MCLVPLLTMYIHISYAPIQLFPILDSCDSVVVLFIDVIRLAQASREDAMMMFRATTRLQPKLIARSVACAARRMWFGSSAS
jgi:hypothetical protein